MESVIEEWRTIQENESYEVSNLGRVKSKERIVPRTTSPRRVRERILAIAKTPKGYCFVNLYCEGKSAQRYVHHLVATAFIGSRGDMEVNHKNGEKSDNRPQNLEYVSRAENMSHARASGLIDICGEKNARSKYTKEQIRHGYSLVESGMEYALAASIAGVNQDALEAACRGVNWKCLELKPIRRAC